MTREEAEEYAKEMTYRDAINNLMKARSIPYRKATFIKVNELLKALEQEPCEDCISRDAVLKQINCWIGSGEYKYAMSEWFLSDRIKTLPPVNPQEPKTDVLDNIRAEILEEKECAYADFERYKVEYLGQEWEDALDSLPQDDFRYGMERCIEIIDKYKAESEE